MKYQVIITGSIAELEEKVDAALAEGWRCQGGVSMTAYQDSNGEYTTESFTCAQAMILTSNPVPNV